MWHERENCLAPYPSNGKIYYPAVIQTLISRSEGRHLAIVHYDGYESEDNEIVDITKLRKINQDEIVSSKRKPIVAIGGQSKPLFTKLKNKNLKESKDDYLSQRQDYGSSLQSRSIISGINGDKNLKPDDFNGFSDADLTKPNFSYLTPHKKVPFVLSEEGEQTVVEIPDMINQYLRDYQQKGVKFLYDCYKENRGGILGDDMGLGKTVQIISFLAALLGKTGTKSDLLRQEPLFLQQLNEKCSQQKKIEKTFLIIVPASVLYNWLEEFDTWGYFTVGKFHKTERDETLRKVHQGKLDIVLTTFETARDHLDELNSYCWDAVIVDEAHKIKEVKAAVTVSLNALKVRRRYGLTGTALQNNMKELWCLLNWANPNCLGSLSYFEKRFIKGIERGQRHDATKRELADARRKKEEFSRLRKKWILRRKKSLISDHLPCKDDLVIFCQLTKIQLDIYRTILNHEDVSLILCQWNRCSCGSGRARSHCCHKENRKRQSIKSLTFTYLSLLLKAANHIALLLPDASGSKNQQMVSRPICEEVFAKYPEFVLNSKEASFRTLSDPTYCGKMKVLTELLEIFRKENSKVLLFSYSTKLLDILEQYVISKGLEYRRLDGKTKTEIRSQLVHEFNNDKQLFLCLVSTKAGGLGLNFTGANVVIIFDPNWNPSHDLQAQDRAYRIGQRRDVRVYRLISSGTIEENIYLRQIYKQHLNLISVETENARRYFEGVQGDPLKKGELFGISNLFDLRTDSECLTYNILQRNYKIESGLIGFQVSKYIPPEAQSYEESQNSNDNEEDPEFSLNFLSQQYPDLDNEIPKISEENGVLNKTSHNSLTVFNVNSEMKKINRRLEDISSLGLSNLPGGNYLEKNENKIKNNSSPIDIIPAEKAMTVDDILKRCGVLHTHANKDIVGKSKAEDHMTRCAIRDVYELNQFSQIPAIKCDPMLESNDEIDSQEIAAEKDLPDSEPFNDCFNSIINHSRLIKTSKSNIIYGGTPKLIKRQHFEKIADSLGISIYDLAKKIESSSQTDLSAILKKFYSQNNPDLGELFDILEEEKNPIITISKKDKRKTAKGNVFLEKKKASKIKKRKIDKNSNSSMIPPNNRGLQEASTLCIPSSSRFCMDNISNSFEQPNIQTKDISKHSLSINDIKNDCAKSTSFFEKNDVNQFDDFILSKKGKIFLGLQDIKHKPSFNFLNDFI